MAVLGWAVVLPVCEQPSCDLPSNTCLGGGRVSPACVPMGAPGACPGGHAPAAKGHWHGGPNHGVARRPAGPPLLGVRIRSAACCASNHACPTARTMDRAPYGGSGTLQASSPVPSPQVPGAPQQRAPLHGPSHPRCTTIGDGSILEDSLVGAFQGPCHVVPPPGPDSGAHVLAAPNGDGGMVP